MPETVQPQEEMNPRLRQWFQMRAAERILQAGNMAKDRGLLRRGAQKQQDGTLGQSGPEPSASASDAMNIAVGDVTNHNYYSQSATVEGGETGSKPSGSLVKLAATGLLGAALGTGLTGGLAYLFGGSQNQPAAAQPADSDTTGRITIEEAEPTLEW